MYNISTRSLSTLLLLVALWAVKVGRYLNVATTSMRYSAPVLPCLLLSGAGNAAAFALDGAGSGGSTTFLSSAASAACLSTNNTVRPDGSGLKMMRTARRSIRTAVMCPGKGITSWDGRQRSVKGSCVHGATSSDDDGMSEERAELLAERKEQLRVLLAATKAEIDKLISVNPTLLVRRNMVDHYDPKLALLQERLGIDQKAAGRLCLLANRLLDLSLETMEAKIDWLQAKLNVDKTQLRKIIKRRPDTLTLKIEENLKPNMGSIQSSLELSDEELTKMVVRQPDLLSKNFSDEKMSARVSLLQEMLRIEEGDIVSLRKVVMASPDILYWRDDCMMETQQWLRRRFDLRDGRIAQMCRNRPMLLSAKVDTLEEKADWLQRELNLHDEELSKIISTAPQLLTYNMEEKIKPMLDYLKGTFGLDKAELKDLLLRYSNLFTLSIQNNLEPKREFYSNLVGKAVASEAMLRKPNLFSVGLKTRLRPRLAELEERGDKGRWSKTLLFRLALRTDAQWEAYGLGDAPRGRAAQ